MNENFRVPIIISIIIGNGRYRTCYGTDIFLFYLYNFFETWYNIMASNDAESKERDMERPSKREIINKVEEAIIAIQKGKREIPYSKHFSQDQYDLGIEAPEDLWPLLQILLEEIKNAGPYATYAGKRPPEKSYEVGLNDLELWAYCWDSDAMNCKMYLKFALKKGHYFYMGCHRSKF